MISFFAGSIINAIIGKILKRVLNQDRPNDLHSEIKLKPGDKGMPSSHATSLGFIGTFTSLKLWGCSADLIPLPVQLCIQILLLAYCVSSLLYRVKVNLHTEQQVYVGAALGTCFGLIWHQFTIGAWPFDVNLALELWIEQKILPETGVLPATFLVFPALVGLFVVGSFERRISRFLSRTRRKDD